MLTRHCKQIRISPSYCSANLTGLGGLGGKVRELSARCARALNLTTVLDPFFVTDTLNNSPPTFRHCQEIVRALTHFHFADNYWTCSIELIETECVCYTPTAKGVYNTQSKATGD